VDTNILHVGQTSVCQFCTGNLHINKTSIVL